MPAAINVGQVDHREEQDNRLPLHLAGEVARTLWTRLARVTGTIVRMGGHPTAAAVLVGRVIRERAAKEVSVKKLDKFSSSMVS